MSMEVTCTAPVRMLLCRVVMAQVVDSIRLPRKGSASIHMGKREQHREYRDDHNHIFLVNETPDHWQ